MAIPIIVQDGAGQSYKLNDQGKYVKINSGMATQADREKVRKDMDENNARGGGKEPVKPTPKAKPVSGARGALGGDTDPGIAGRLDRLIDAHRGQTYFLERMFNVLQRSPIINPKMGAAAPAKKPGDHSDLKDEERENLKRNKDSGKGFIGRMVDGFGGFMKSIAGWAKILEVLLLPLLIGLIAKLSQAQSVVAKIAAGTIAALAFGPTRRLIGKGLKWLGGKTVDALRGGTKEEFAARKAAGAAEKEVAATGKVSQEAEAVTTTAKEAGEVDKLGRKMPARAANGRFVKAAAQEEEGLFSLIGKVMPKIAPVFRILGKALIILNIVSTAVEGIKGAIDGYKQGGAAGAVAGGARGIANGLVGWIFSLATWAVGSLFKLFGADQIGEKIKEFDFNKLLDKVTDWVADGISTIMDSLKKTFSGGFFSGLGKILMAPIDAMKGYLGGMLDSLPDVIKKHIPASVWTFVGRNGDGSQIAVATESDKRQSAVAAGGQAALNRHNEAKVLGDGTDYEANLSAGDRKKFEGQIADLRAGKHVDAASMSKTLQAANPNASADDVNKYLKNVVYAQVHSQAAIGGSALSMATVGQAGGSSPFDAVIGGTLKAEGGYVKDQDGETNFGINDRANKGLLDSMGITDMKKITVDQAKLIYKKKYWDDAGIGNAPVAFQRQLFDISVNMGPGAAKKFLAEIKSGKIKTPADLLAARKAKYDDIAKANPGKAKYLKGWDSRSDSIYQQSLADIKPGNTGAMAAQAASITPPVNANKSSVASTGGAGGVVIAPTVNNKSTVNHAPVLSAAPPSATAPAVA